MNSGDWFDDHVLRVVGNGEMTLFCHDLGWKLKGYGKLRERYSRLFVVCYNTNVSMKNMFRLGWWLMEVLEFGGIVYLYGKRICY